MDKKRANHLNFVMLEPTGPPTNLKDGTPFPSAAGVMGRVSLTGSREPSDSDLLVNLVVEVVDGTAVVQSISIAAPPDGDGVTPAKLRSLDLAGVVADVEAYLATYANVRAPQRDQFDRYRQRFDRRRHEMTDDLLRTVATLYAEGKRAGRPTQYVAETYPTSYRSATRWIKAAREKRFIPEGD